MSHDNAEVQVKTPEGDKGPEVETLENLGDLQPEAAKTDEQVPLKKYMGEKDARRDAETRATTAESQAQAAAEEIAKLKANLAGMSVGGVNEEISRLARDHNIDETFLAGLVTTVRKVTKDELLAEIDKTVNPQLAAINQREAAKARDNKFDDVFTKTLGEMPEYSGIVSKEAIKALAFNPANSKKTMTQIIEETYQNALAGKRTIEGGRSGRQPTAPNTDSPQTQEDWEKISADPEAKKAWSKAAEEQLRSFL